MDGVQHVTIPGNLGLVTVSRRCLCLYQIFQPIIFCRNTFDSIGSFCTLNFGNLHQFVKFIAVCFNEQSLLSFVFMNKREFFNNLWGQ